jgi:hypothetical protein
MKSLVIQDCICDHHQTGVGHILEAMAALLIRFPTRSFPFSPPNVKDAPTNTSSPTRRQALTWGGIGLVTTLIGALGWHWGSPRIRSLLHASAPSPTAGDSPVRESSPSVPTSGPLSRSSFAPYLNNDFLLQAGGARTIFTAKLIEVSSERTQRTHKGVFSDFSILFEAPRFVSPDEGYFLVSHSLKGSVQIFLSPVGRSEKHTLLQAVISQRI